MRNEHNGTKELKRKLSKWKMLIKPVSKQPSNELEKISDCKHIVS